MVSAGRRNAAVFFATAATVGLLFIYPTSTNRGDAQSRPGAAIAPPGVVSPSTGASAGASPDPGTV